MIHTGILNDQPVANLANETHTTANYLYGNKCHFSLDYVGISYYLSEGNEFITLALLECLKIIVLIYQQRLYLQSLCLL